MTENAWYIYTRGLWKRVHTFDRSTPSLPLAVPGQHTAIGVHIPATVLLYRYVQRSLYQHCRHSKWYITRSCTYKGTNFISYIFTLELHVLRWTHCPFWCSSPDERQFLRNTYIYNVTSTSALRFVELEFHKLTFQTVLHQNIRNERTPHFNQP